MENSKKNRVFGILV